MSRHLTTLGLGLWLLSAYPPAPALAETASPVHSLEIRGEATMAPIAQKVAEGYMASNADDIVTVAACGGPLAIKSLVLGTSQMAMAADRLSEETEKFAADHKVSLIRREVYRDALVIVVDAKNPVKNLTLAELRDIFRGAITDWHALGNKKKLPIEVLSPLPTTAAFEVFKRDVLGPTAVLAPAATSLAWGDLEKAVHANSIAFITSGQVAASGLKSLTIDGIAANPETIRHGSYPILRTLTFYQRAPGTPLAEKFIDFFLGPGGARFIAADGGVAMTATGSAAK